MKKLIALNSLRLPIGLLIPVLLFMACTKPSTPQPQTPTSNQALVGTWVQDSAYFDNLMNNEACCGWFDYVTFSASTFVNYDKAYPGGQGVQKYTISGNTISTAGEIAPGGWDSYTFTITGSLLKLSNTSVSNNPYYAYYHKQ